MRPFWVLVALAGPAAADPTLPSDSFGYQPGGLLRLDGGLQIGVPTALPTGLSRGLGAGFTYGHCPFRWGARAAWVTATEYTQAFEVTHSDLRLRATGSIQHDVGRGSFGLRLGAGGTLVHETRLRAQGMRAGASGDLLETSAFRMVPAGDLEAVIALHVIGPWQMTLSAGPSAAYLPHDLHGSWTAQLGVAWQP